MNQEKYERNAVNELFDEMIEEIEFEKGWEEYKAGKSPLKIHIPTYAEVKDKLIKKTGKSRSPTENILQQAAAISIQAAAQLKSWFQMSFAAQSSSIPDNPDLTIKAPLRGKEVLLNFWKTENGIEVLSPATEIVGEVLVLKFSDNTELKGEFFEDDITLENMKANVIFKESDDLDFSKIISVEIEK